MAVSSVLKIMVKEGCEMLLNIIHPLVVFSLIFFSCKLLLWDISNLAHIDL